MIHANNIKPNSVTYQNLIYMVIASSVNLNKNPLFSYSTFTYQTSGSEIC